MKRFVALILAVLLVFGASGQALAGVAFTDTAGDSNAAAIVRLAALGIIRGYSDGSFKPEANITRAEFAALVVRALGLESQAKTLTTKPNFTDVGNADKWAWGYIFLAAERGIVKGDPTGRFRPRDNVTHAEAITMLVRALGREGEVDPTTAWPDGHIVVSESIGLGYIRLVKTEPATRCAVASYLNIALEQPIVAITPSGMTVTGSSFLSLQGTSAYTGTALAVAPAGSSPNWIEFADGTIKRADADTAPDRVELAADATLSGITALADMAGRPVSVVLNKEGKAIYVAPYLTVSGKIKQAAAPFVMLEDGSTYTLTGDPLIRINGQSGVPLSLAWLVFQPGFDIRVTLDPESTGKATAVDVYATMAGKLEWLDNHYVMTTMTGSTPIWPGDPAGFFTSNTDIFINLCEADEAVLQDFLESDRVSVAEFAMDAVTGKASAMYVSSFNGQATYAQPMVSKTQQSFTIPAGTDSATPSTYSLAPSACIIKDGKVVTMNDLVQGDLLSFATIGGEVTYMIVNTDNLEPVLTNAMGGIDRNFLWLNEAIDPKTVQVTVNGIEHTLAPEPFVYPVTSNCFKVEYYPGQSVENGRTGIFVYSTVLSKTIPNTITLKARDYAGNEISTTFTLVW